MEPKNPSPQAKLLRDLRKATRLSTKEFAKDFNAIPNHISLFEYGRRKIGELWARRFGEYFKRDWRDFYEP